MKEQIQIGKRKPIIAVSNIFGGDAARLTDFASNVGFTGIEWSIDPHASDIELLKQIDLLKDFEVRFHMRWSGIEFAYADDRSEMAMDLYRNKLELLAIMGGEYNTIHLGLGRIDLKELDWRKAIDNLAELVFFGNELGIKVCLENIVANWTGKPELFRRIIRQTGAGITLDIGHLHVCQMNTPKQNLYEQFTKPNRDNIFGAHIYHTEIPNVGHISPDNLLQMKKRLALVNSLPSCNWWLIELTKPSEILKTREICHQFLALSVKHPQPIAAN
ncbi:MAG: sugar phosphate isomerase/epimerase [Dehalococcoidia bacterium]|nr:MAG: sugar phosphate isomerase/epimerase [Dehalococcoidia bacterium]